MNKNMSQKKKINELIQKYERMSNLWISELASQLEEEREPSHMFYVNPDVATTNITNFKSMKRDLEELLK